MPTLVRFIKYFFLFFLMLILAGGEYPHIYRKAIYSMLAAAAFILASLIIKGIKHTKKKNK